MQLYFCFDEPIQNIYHTISEAYIHFDYFRIYDLDLKHNYFTHINNSWRFKKNER